MQLLPQLILPGADGALEARTDSTPLIRLLEQRADAGRSVIPPDRALAFIDALLEDYADEWLTKAMFHYRWAFAADVANAAAILPRWFRTDQPEEAAVGAGALFAERQVGRLGVVGSNPATAPVIEASYRRLLRLLDAHLTARASSSAAGRPAPTSPSTVSSRSWSASIRRRRRSRAASRRASWRGSTSSRTSPASSRPTRDWTSRDAVPDTLRALLGEVGRVYAPFLLANADALARGAEHVECTIDGRPWVQRPFPYQGKCLALAARGLRGARRRRPRAPSTRCSPAPAASALFA